MYVRKLKKEERFEAGRISMIAFHERLESNPEEKRAECEQETVEDWGAFTDEGTMMARIINNRFLTYFDGHRIENGGIGAVSTLPEYRESGAIKEILLNLLPVAYENGEIISTLFPFNQAFYRKFGYETVCWQHNYEFAPSVLQGYHFVGTAQLWNPADSVVEYTKLYNKFAANYNLAVWRDDERMLNQHIKGEYYKDRKFCYLLSDEEGPSAYLIFQDVHNDPAAILRVEDIAWDGKRGFYAILGFLSRFAADYGMIQMFLPAGVELLSIIQSPRSYEINKVTRQDYMVRVVNVEKLLALMHKPDEDSFVIQVTDEIISANNGIWFVKGDSAVSTDTAPDIIVSERALAQMAVGCVDLDEAILRRDVTLHGNEQVLKKVFIRKKLLMKEYF